MRFETTTGNGSSESSSTSTNESQRSISSSRVAERKDAFDGMTLPMLSETEAHKHNVSEVSETERCFHPLADPTKSEYFKFLSDSDPDSGVYRLPTKSEVAAMLKAE